MEVIGLRRRFSPRERRYQIPASQTSLTAVPRRSQRKLRFHKALTLRFRRHPSFSADPKFRTKKEESFNRTIDCKKVVESDGSRRNQK